MLNSHITDFLGKDEVCPDFPIYHSISKAVLITNGHYLNNQLIFILHFVTGSNTSDRKIEGKKTCEKSFIVLEYVGN